MGENSHTLIAGFADDGSVSFFVITKTGICKRIASGERLKEFENGAERFSITEPAHIELLLKYMDENFDGESEAELIIEADADNADGLNFLAGKGMSFINKKAFEGTVLAHTDGGVPNIVIEADKMDEYDLGQLIYFFEKACAISGYVLGVNPFDQPGVESYKKNMFALLGKPGYEELADELKKRLEE